RSLRLARTNIATRSSNAMKKLLARPMRVQLHFPRDRLHLNQGPPRLRGGPSVSTSCYLPLPRRFHPDVSPCRRLFEASRVDRISACTTGPRTKPAPAPPSP